MSGPSTRAAAVLAVTARVNAHLSRPLPAREAVAVSLACSILKHDEEVVGMLLDSRLSREAAAVAGKLAVSPQEWTALVGRDAPPPVREGGVGELLKSRHVASTCSALGDALCCTLTEKACERVWKQPVSQLACYVAAHHSSGEESVASVLGSLVRSDVRRIEQISADLEAESDAYQLGLAVLAISSSVC
jgi:hypothetical protein